VSCGNGQLQRRRSSRRCFHPGPAIGFAAARRQPSLPGRPAAPAPPRLSQAGERCWSLFARPRAAGPITSPRHVSGGPCHGDLGREASIGFRPVLGVPSSDGRAPASSLSGHPRHSHSALYGVAQPGDAAAGPHRPAPTTPLKEVIGLRGSGPGSLAEFGIHYVTTWKLDAGRPRWTLAAGWPTPLRGSHAGMGLIPNGSLSATAGVPSRLSPAIRGADRGGSKALQAWLPLFCDNC